MGLIWTVVNVEVECLFGEGPRHFDGYEKRHTGCEFELSVYADVSSNRGAAVYAILYEIEESCRMCDEEYMIAPIEKLFAYVETNEGGGKRLIRLEDVKTLKEGDKIRVQEWSDSATDRDLPVAAPSLARANDPIEVNEEF